jgi:hypothetical protein
MTSRLSPINIRTRSIVPPLYPAIMPTMMAITLETNAEMREMIKELRTAKVACQKISCPFESVPSHVISRWRQVSRHNMPLGRVKGREKGQHGHDHDDHKYDEAEGEAIVLNKSLSIFMVSAFLMYIYSWVKQGICQVDDQDRGCDTNDRKEQ